MDMKQFEVYMVNLDPTVGAEMKKFGPAVIVSPDVMNKNLQTVIVAHSHIRSKDIHHV